MTATAVPARVRRPSPARGRRRRVLIAVMLVVGAVGVFALRLANRSPAATAVAAPTAHYVPIPADPAIEAAWGIRFTALIIAADGGVLDVRYQVVDPAKSGRIHGGSTNNPDPQAAVKNLPSFIRESDGQRILPGSAMMHFEHFHFQTEALGNTYSILYGNSGGLLHVGDKVTIVMTDGLRLAHVTVSS